MAEFATPTALVDAARKVREAGFHAGGRLHAVSDRGARRRARPDRTQLPLIVLVRRPDSAWLGGLRPRSTGRQVIDYPMNIGGRPFHSWPAFIVPTFETTILCAALSAVIGMLALNGLPMPYHPVFNVPALRAARRATATSW